jgi:hypothetical protein
MMHGQQNIKKFERSCALKFMVLFENMKITKTLIDDNLFILPTVAISTS